MSQLPACRSTATHRTGTTRLFRPSTGCQQSPERSYPAETHRPRWPPWSHTQALLGAFAPKRDVTQCTVPEIVPASAWETDSHTGLGQGRQSPRSPGGTFSIGRCHRALGMKGQQVPPGPADGWRAGVEGGSRIQTNLCFCLSVCLGCAFCVGGKGTRAGKGGGTSSAASSAAGGRGLWTEGVV